MEFTPDNSKIVFTAARSENEFGIYTVNFGGGALTRIGDGEEAQLNLAGTKLVITRVISGAGEIGTLNLNGSGFTRLTNNAIEDFMPQWSKDGAQIVFSTDRNGGQFDVYRMNANGSSLTQLTSTSLDEYGPSLNDAGDQVAFVILSGDVGAYGLYRRPVGAGSATPVVLSPVMNQQAYWTPDPGSGIGGRVRKRDVLAYVGCIAGALSIGEFRAGLEGVGMTSITITPTHVVADGMLSAIVQAVKPFEREGPATRQRAAAGTCGGCC